MGGPWSRPPGTYLDPGRTRGLARSELLIRGFDPEVESGIGSELLGLPAYRGTFAHHRRGRLPYIIVRTTSRGSESSFRVVHYEGALIVVDEAVLGDLSERGA